MINPGMHATTIYFSVPLVIFACPHTQLARPVSWISRGNVMSACSTTSHLSIPACQKERRRHRRSQLFARRRQDLLEAARPPSSPRYLRELVL